MDGLVVANPMPASAYYVSGVTRAKVQQARELLAPVYGWFTEGFDTLDIEGSEGAVLEELGPS